MPTPSDSTSASSVFESVLAIAAFMRPETSMRHRSRRMRCGAGMVILSMTPWRHSTSASAMMPPMTSVRYQPTRVTLVQPSGFDGLHRLVAQRVPQPRGDAAELRPLDDAAIAIAGPSGLDDV